MYELVVFPLDYWELEEEKAIVHCYDISAHFLATASKFVHFTDIIMS